VFHEKRGLAIVDDSIVTPGKNEAVAPANGSYPALSSASTIGLVPCSRLPWIAVGRLPFLAPRLCHPPIAGSLPCRPFTFPQVAPVRSHHSHDPLDQRINHPQEKKSRVNNLHHLSHYCTPNRLEI
jgi:hypothetical protein